MLNFNYKDSSNSNLKTESEVPIVKSTKYLNNPYNPKITTYKSAKQDTPEKQEKQEIVKNESRMISKNSLQVVKTDIFKNRYKQNKEKESSTNLNSSFENYLNCIDAKNIKKKEVNIFSITLKLYRMNIL